jgi:hypothetical protein
MSDGALARPAILNITSMIVIAHDCRLSTAAF